MNKHVKAWRKAQRRKPSEERVFCQNWNAPFEHGPQALQIFDGPVPSRLRTIGVLIPVDEELVANSPGIQSWSKRGGQRSGRTV